MAIKKTSVKKSARRKALSRRPKKPALIAVSVKRSRNAVTISYDKAEEVLPHILDLASDFADKHFAKASFTTAEDEVLGTVAARDVVSGCSDSDCWSCTLSDLKLDSGVFQSCVFEGVQGKGYRIGRDEIPTSQSTQLYTVVMAIQDAQKDKEG